MYCLPLTLLSLSYVQCEWVEISQQHYNYKKPLKPTYNYPLLTTTSKDDLERTTSRNRIYINHSLSEYNWKSDVNKLFNEDVLDKSVVKFKDSYDLVHKRRGSDENTDVITLRRTRPGNSRNEEKKEDLYNSQSYNGNRKKSDDQKDNRKPFGDFKGPIEVIDISELDYTTVQNISNSFEDGEPYKNNLKRKENFISDVISPNNNRRSGAQLETTKPYKRKQVTPEFEHNTNPPLLKTPSMRRVNIIRSTSTYRTPTQHLQEENYHLKAPETPSRPSERDEVGIKQRPPTTPYRFPHIGHVKRVNVTHATRTTSKPKSKDINITERVKPENSVSENTKASEKYNINRKTNKPLTSDSTLTNSDSTKIKTHKTRYENKDNHKTLSPEDIMVEEIISEGETNKILAVHKVESVGNVHRVRIPSDSETEKRNDKKPGTTAAPELETGTELVKEKEKSDHHFNRLHEVTNFPDNPETKLKHKNPATERPKELSQIERYQPNPYKPVRPSRDPVPEFVTKDESFVISDSRESTSEKTYELKPTESTNEEFVRPGNYPKNKYKDTKNHGDMNESKEQKSEDPISDKTKPSAIENLIKFLKTVTDIISRNSRRGVLGKVRYLEDLRDTILENIEERLEAVFPEDAPTRGRRARDAEPRGHVEFPSSESALMTISFLTFAVFLIKLILQVIHAYKNKAMMVMPTVISAAVGRAFAHSQTPNPK